VRLGWASIYPLKSKRLRELLVESIRLRLRADVPVGCYLSGGIDSCSVLGIASRLSQKPITAFTISFEQDNLDETSIAQAMAEHAVVQNENVIEMNGVAKYVLSEKVRDLDYKTARSGELCRGGRRMLSLPSSHQPLAPKCGLAGSAPTRHGRPEFVPSRGW
jgi:hypothetical protein